MKHLQNEIKEMIKSPLVCSSSSQCRSIGFGAKPCGGFYSYLRFSQQNTDEERLTEKVNLYNKLSRKWNNDNNVVSNCMMLMQPELVCINQRCQSQ